MWISSYIANAFDFGLHDWFCWKWIEHPSYCPAFEAYFKDEVKFTHIWLYLCNIIIYYVLGIYLSFRNLNGYNKNVEQFDRILLSQVIFDTLLALIYPFCYAYMAISYHLNLSIVKGELFSCNLMTYGFPYFFYPFSGIVRYGSSLSTVSMTIERFCSITLPLKKLDFVKKSLIPFTIIFSILMGIPRFLEVGSQFKPM